MNDKELLELAAKAAGIEIEFDEAGSPFHKGAVGWSYWNPLTDDGDRYRLIRRLEMAVNFKYQYAEYEGICVCWPQDAKDEAYAVAMVAAEIGRTK